LQYEINIPDEKQSTKQSANKLRRKGHMSFKFLEIAPAMTALTFYKGRMPQGHENY
jgi:hypothetical protein